jgi:hypothetical protein
VNVTCLRKKHLLACCPPDGESIVEHVAGVEDY